MAASATDWDLPFAVECDHDVNVEDASIDKRFATYDEAVGYAEIAMEKFRGVWVSEIGTFESPRGKIVTDWVYFWWTPATEWGELYGRRTGFAASYSNHLKSYQPLNDQSGPKS